MKKKPKIVLVDDCQDSLSSYQEILKDDFDIKLYHLPADAVKAVSKDNPDLIVLDLHMPDLNGFELFSMLRGNEYAGPIIFLTSDPDEESIVQGLGSGADDYIVKPVTAPEMIARFKNKISKHKLGVSSDVIRVEGLNLYCDIQNAEVDNVKIPLTPIEFKILHCFLKNPNIVISKEHLFKNVWHESDARQQNIDTHLSNLRKKTRPFSNRIKTIKSVGYILRL